MSFAEDIEKFIEKTKAKTDDVVRKVTIDLARGVVRMSPVDTGRFRGNWMLGIGGVDASTMEITDPDGTDALGRIEGQTDKIKAGETIFITNSLPYAIPLEYGHSSQAPSGMVRLVVREYQTYIENAIRSVQ